MRCPNWLASPSIPPATDGIWTDQEKAQPATFWLSREFAGARPLALIILLILLGTLLLLSLALGSASIPFDQVLSVLLSGEADQRAWTNIVLKFRLPKTLTAMFAGMALGVSGLLMQTYFRNPLAEPFVLGLSSGASLGVALVVLTTSASRWRPARRAGLGGRSAADGRRWLRRRHHDGLGSACCCSHS